MICEGTGGGGETCTFVEALFAGLDRQGGLLLPRDWPALARGEIDELLALDFVERSSRLTRRLLGDELGETACDRIVRDALNFPVPLARIDERVFALELFHGPTLAFKDFGARFMARAMAEGRRLGAPGGGRITILTATSGDTGSAVARAFHGIEGIDVVILYPAGRISPVQELQMITLGGNIHPLAVRGTFDDCQRLVKGALGDAELRRDAGLTTANSMNLGRLVPQVFYYFEAVAPLRRRGGGHGVVVSVPSGNFGNLTAGILAWRLGLPVSGFIAATNANDTVPRYLADGAYAPRATVATLSTAMDVAAPNNWGRIERLFTGDLRAIRDLVRAESVTDDETLRAIREVHSRTGYTLDPHAAVGYAAMERIGLPEAMCGVVLATAHPAKFNEVLRRALGREVPLPERLARCLELPHERRDLEGTAEALRGFLLTLRGRQ